MNESIIDRILSDLRDTRDTMTNTLHQLSVRGERLERLTDKSKDLAEFSTAFTGSFSYRLARYRRAIFATIVICVFLIVFYCFILWPKEKGNAKE